MEPYNPTPEQYKKDYFKELSWFWKVLVRLRIVMLKRNRSWNGMYYTTERLNPYNPISYIFAIIFFIIMMLIAIFECGDKTVDNFRYN